MKKIILGLLLYCFVHAQGVYDTEIIISSSEKKLCVPDIAALSDGGFIVVWSNKDPENYGIYGQRFDADGRAVGKQFNIQSKVPEYCDYPLVTGLDYGGFAVAWQNRVNGTLNDIFVRSFDSLANPLSREFCVHNQDELIRFISDIINPSGNELIVCWYSNFENGLRTSIRGRHFSVIGESLSKAFFINEDNSYLPSSAKVIRLKKGHLVYCWGEARRIYVDGFDNMNLFARIYTINGPLSEFVVNITPGKYMFEYDIASCGDGFVVCWQSFGADNNNDGILGQLFGQNGNKIGTEFLINSHTIDSQTNPRATGVADGGFLISWSSNNQDGDGLGVYCQRFDAAGTKRGKEFLINTATDNSQVNHNLVSLSGGQFVVCWQNLLHEYGTSDIRFKLYPAPRSVSLINYFLLSPQNDVTLTSRTVSLIWEPAAVDTFYSWEVTYDIYLADNPAFVNPVIIPGIEVPKYTHSGLTPGKTYFWKVLARNLSGDLLWCNKPFAFFVSHDIVGVDQFSGALCDFHLAQNYPNPFNPFTHLEYALPRAGYIELTIYDLLGKHVKTLVQKFHTSGNYQVNWDGTDSTGKKVAAGIYLYRLEISTQNGEKYVRSRKMSLVK
ncbi:T9SS type A sorting domain-containing protein [candidate division KSB1 bacterium]|nr:T9SS type A sorting domain-containing protein [candidate division KSB1 bacterium]